MKAKHLVHDAVETSCELGFNSSGLALRLTIAGTSLCESLRALQNRGIVMKGVLSTGANTGQSHARVLKT